MQWHRINVHILEGKHGDGEERPHAWTQIEKIPKPTLLREASGPSGEIILTPKTWVVPSFRFLLCSTHNLSLVPSLSDSPTTFNILESPFQVRLHLQLYTWSFRASSLGIQTCSTLLCLSDFLKPSRPPPNLYCIFHDYIAHTLWMMLSSLLPVQGLLSILGPQLHSLTSAYLAGWS